MSSAVSAALAAAAGLVLGSAAIDSIYDHVTDAAHSASAILSLVSASPKLSQYMCKWNLSVTTSTSDDGTGPTSVSPPTSTTSTTSTQPATTSTGGNGCFARYEKRTWGVRIPESRPSYSCYVSIKLRMVHTGSSVLILLLNRSHATGGLYGASGANQRFKSIPT